MLHKTEKLLLDIRISCEEIIEFTAGKTFEDFQTDRLLQLAIERIFEIIGEAMNRLLREDPEGLEAKIPEYQAIIGFRNLLAHGYDIIDDASLWDFTQNEVSRLLKQIETY